jgi:hypothetical protein
MLTSKDDVRMPYWTCPDMLLWLICALLVPSVAVMVRLIVVTILFCMCSTILSFLHVRQM